MHRFSQRSSRLFSTSTMVPRYHQLGPRSATPDSLPEAVKPITKQSTNDEHDKHEDLDQDSITEREMEGNAARMLLELSRIVSREISSDSNCITRGSETRDIKNQEELFRDSKDLSSRGTSVSKKPSSSSLSIPKSIEIHNRDLSSASENSMALKSSSYSSLLGQRLPMTLSRNSSFETYSISAEQSQTNRHRTVSLTGDEMAVDEKEQLSPLLLPLHQTPRTPPKDLSPFFQTVRTPSRSAIHHLPRFRQHPLFSEHHELEQHKAIQRALVAGGSGAKALSNVLVSSSAATAAVITPVPEKPRSILSFPSTQNQHSSRGSNNDSLIQEHSEDCKRLFPMELPPLLFQSNQQNQNNMVLPAVSRVPARSCAKPTKRVASLAAKPSPSIRKGTSKKNQPQSPKTKTKKRTVAAKKHSRYRHTGKKFSWKAYPELEEFLIAHREEYLSYSAKNYTIEQRDYNNRLTARLLEHAEANGYSTLFEDCAFSAVRDRIRSYYKSYVQSFKRRKERQEQHDRIKKLEPGCN